MLAALLLSGMVAAPVSSAALFVGRPHLRRRGSWHATRRFVLALLGTAVLAGLVDLVMTLLGVAHRLLLASVLALVLGSLVWLPVTRRWNARAHLCWASSVFMFVTYLAFILNWTFVSHLGPFSTAAGLVLWLLEVFAALLACAYLWELCDVMGTESWRRRITPTTPLPPVSGPPPFVSLHVPAHNEPPDMVIQTLETLQQIDYPRYEVIVVDDNSDDPRLYRPVEDWCQQHGVTFAHLKDWPGYKSGALNFALERLTSPEAELIGVVDSDYRIAPGFLARCAPLFADPKVGFIQAPQDYRSWARTPYLRRLYYSYKYFFAVSQPSRNERDAAIFAGTMGLIRRSALEAVGGWDEWCITEDAELSLRLLRGGWSGLHVDQSWGRGVMPLTFEALKSQRYRWCFGGIQILRMHWRWLLPGRRSRDNRLTQAQRWGYLSGGLQWYGDLLGLLFYVFLLAGAANLASGGGQLFRKLTAFLVATVPVLVALGLLRAIALVRRGTGATWRDAIGAFFIWQSTGLVVARASVQALFARKAVFLRTPKTSEQTSWWQALRANAGETFLAMLGVAGFVAALTRLNTFSGPLLAGLLVFPTLGLAAAPVNSLVAQRVPLPAELERRRRSEWARESRTAARFAAAGGVATALALAGAVLVLLLTPTRAPVAPPRLVPAPSGSAKVTPPPSGSSSSSTSSSSSPSSTPTSSTTTTNSSTSATTSPSTSPTASPTSTTTTSSTAPSSAATTGVAPTGAAPTGATPTSAAASTAAPTAASSGAATPGAAPTSAAGGSMRLPSG